MEQLTIRKITMSELRQFGFDSRNFVRSKEPIAHESNVLGINQYYSVAHVLIEFENGGEKVFIPVHPFFHADKQFAPTAPAHYHIDGRFNYAPYFYCGNGFTTTAVFAPGTCKMINNGPDYHYNSCRDNLYFIKELVYIRRRCIRITTGLFSPDREESQIPKLYKDWAKSMVGKSCAGKKCPHYGTTMIDAGDTLVCPMHGLIGSKTLEIIIEN